MNLTMPSIRQTAEFWGKVLDLIYDSYIAPELARAGADYIVYQHDNERYMMQATQHG